MKSLASPLISVLLPVYNMEEYVEDAIQSVLSDGYTELELLVIDDGSSDDTVRRVKKFTQSESVSFDKRVKVIEKANGGKSTAVNLGLKECNGQFIMIMDADDELSDQGLSCRLELLRQVGSECAMVIGGFEVFESTDSVGTRPLNDLTNTAEQLKRKFYLAFKTPFHLNSCLISRPLFEKVGLFDVNLRRCQDIDYSMRCLTHVDELKLSGAIVYRYRKHRGEKKDRVRLRLKTIRHRMTVFWKNIEGPTKPLGVLCGLGMDMLKLVYEMFGNYKN